jgi:hypothetical protein
MISQPMRISNEERREVAEKLRERTKKPMGKSMQRMFTETIGMYAHNICWMNPDKATNRWDVIVNYLADLIDRPTRRNVSGHQDVFECSECRCRVELIAEVCNEHGEPFHVPLMPSFCPNCEAEVLDD